MTTMEQELGVQRKKIARLKEETERLAAWKRKSLKELKEKDEAITALKLQVAAERDDAYRKGVRAAFDYCRAHTANHWSLKPDIQAQMNIENEAIDNVSEEFLASLSPTNHTEWVELTKAFAQINELRAEVERLRAREVSAAAVMAPVLKERFS